MGYDFVPGALAGALALEEAGEDAVRVDVGYYALGMTTQSGSTGTRASLVGASLDESHAFRDGALRNVRTAERVRSFPVKDKERPAVSVGGAEHLALPGAYPQLQEVNVYLGWFGPFARPMQAGALVGSVATRLPGVREALTFAGERLAALAEGPEAGTTPGGESLDRRAGVRRRRASAGRGPPHRRQLVRVHRRLHRLGGARRARAGGSRAPARSGRSRRSGSRSSSAAARCRAQPRSRLSSGPRRTSPAATGPAGSTPPSSVTRSGDFAGRRRRQRRRSSALAGPNTAGSRSGQISHRGAGEPLASRIPLTARRAASLAPSMVARSVCVRT